MTRASLVDVVRAERAGYRFERSDAGWMLADPEGGYLMIGDHGCVAPTKAEAVAEALERIEMNEPTGAGDDPYGRPDPRTHPEFWTE